MHCDHTRLSAVLASAIELPISERRAYLDVACAGDAALRREIESLLSHNGNAPAILSPPAEPREHALPERIGRYHVLEKLGEGGMGVVYLAEQRVPIRRKVAVKCIRAGWETQHVLARFDLERRNLATMDHLGIARVIDAGSTEDGHPYFAMEYVPGESLTRHCDRRCLSIEARIELFLGVCDAVQHAHYRGIIHRDLKPSNILVSEVEGHFVPKIIDFGIAKALATEADDAAPVTVDGQLLGTPEYMSPEQATGSAAVDTRTDVFALGVVLYELLAGKRQFRTEGPSPSASVAGLGQAAVPVAHARAYSSKALIARLRGDLDSIVMKALERVPDDRYSSVADLAADLRRHVAHEPVAARSPTLIYRTRKFARRHRAGAVLIAVLVPLGVVFAAAMATQTRRIARERDRAERMSSFLQETFYAVPETVTQRWGARSAEESLLAGLEKIDHVFQDPLERARMYHNFARTLRSARLFEPAETAIQRAYAGFATALGPDDAETLGSAAELGRIYNWQERFREAQAQLQDTLERQRRVLGDAHPDTIATVLELAQSFKLDWQFARAATLFDESVGTLSKVAGPESKDTLVAKSLLASVELELRQLDGAEELLLDILSRIDTLPWLERGMAVYNFACVRALRGDRDGALAALRRAVDEYGFFIGFNTDPSFASLYDDAEFQKLYKRGLIARDGFRTMEVLDRASCDADEGHYEKAQRLLEAVRRNVRDDASKASKAGVDWRLATEVYLPQGRYEDAEPLLLGGVALARATHNADLADCLPLLALARYGQGDIEGATAALEEAIRIVEHRPSNSHPWPQVAYLNALVSAVRGDKERALRALVRAYELGYPEFEKLDVPPFASLRRAPDFVRIRDGMKKRNDYP
jgi:non-specific serine/threonine protein kinase/serine/threonine-protein kinase